MRGMTIWAAYASFQENEKGSLEKGKKATFVIFDKAVNSEGDYRANFAFATFVGGVKVYGVE